MTQKSRYYTHTNYLYLLLVQQPAVCLKVAVHGRRMDLSLSLRCLHRAGHSLEHIYRGGAHDPSYAVVEPRGQHCVQDGDLLLGQRGGLRLGERGSGARRPETCLLHHLHQLVLHILDRTWSQTHEIRQEVEEKHTDVDVQTQVFVTSIVMRAVRLRKCFLQ